MTIAVYKIENKENNKVYIGGTANIKSRWANHKSKLKNSKHRNIYLQKDWDKYGEDNFKFEILEEVEDENDLLERELFYLNNTNHKYNIFKKISKNLGWKMPKETRERISNKKKGHFLSKETKEKISKSKKGKNNAMYGKQHTEKTKRKISKALKGRNHTKKTKEKISKNSPNVKGEDHPSSKLSKKEVLEIRKLVKSVDVKELANTYNVSKSTIYAIKNRRKWKHI